MGGLCWFRPGPEFWWLHVAPHGCLHDLWLPCPQAYCHLSKHALLCCRQFVTCRQVVIKNCCVHCHHSVQLLSVGLCMLQAAKSEAPARHHRGRSVFARTYSDFHNWTRAQAPGCLQCFLTDNLMQRVNRPSTACIAPCAHQYLFVQRIACL